MKTTEEDHHSFSPTVGSGGGNTFVTEGIGRITAVRVWEAFKAFIVGIQLRCEYVWTNVVSGKYSNFSLQLIFVTSKGRLLICCQRGQEKMPSSDSSVAASTEMGLLQWELIGE
ncbi:zymogen granule membrane protein 16-like [Phycodurus eques]|uniref:zymogen granule membrane protein 16-like n=1 Tax=Phycodurus eques TaxID=693459 RepID=UPI002ACD8FEE|nr:zymogen granule membrane protein 16-like [Phycodurus eques]